ncbi:IclR family transcriptional regulator [Sulfoacidibacillus thermotolerans]|uniref:IclR family transcriptional regulator n=1 Tax=Sulfoacidibacillus thermotolerans TaxID=1765684 RepID=A0A2U3D782_SULT2|nr:IclR family transcriptional regulator [Sulfoacidibacillus thermotolerans]PWI57131.1 hypothetical protein BM613_10270 [Sulfoacidibacillus thermotolerans]
MLSSVQHIISILRLFRLDRPEMSLAQVSRYTGLPKSTTNKLLQTLVNMGFLEKVAERAHYRPSLQMFEMSHFILNHLALVQEAAPFIRHLAKQSGQVAHLTCYDKGEVTWLVKITHAHNDHLYSRVGRRAPASIAASGKAVLAFLEVQEWLPTFESGWRRLTVKSNMDPNVLLRELDFVRKNGYSFQEEEVDLGVCSIGAPIFNERMRPIASVSLAGHVNLFTTEMIKQYGRLTKHTALAISERIGCRSN